MSATATVQAPWRWSPRTLAMRAVMTVLGRFKVRSVMIYVDRRDKPAWTAQIGRL